MKTITEAREIYDTSTN